MRLNEPNVFKVRLHQVSLRRKVEPVKVMCTGDWHVSPIVSEQQFEFLEQALTRIKPDVIILQGDLVDSPVELKRDSSLKKLMRELKLCSGFAPTVMVLGSHDYITPTQPPKNMAKTAIPTWQKICKKCGVKLLLDEWIELKNIRIFGSFQDERCMKVPGKENYHDNPDGFLACLLDAEDKILAGLPAQKVDPSNGTYRNNQTEKVLWFASHAPLLNDAVIELLRPFDMASFGHTHGGIVPLGLDEIFEKFGLHFGLISPNHTPFPKRVRGAMPISDSTIMLVNPGMIATHFCVSKWLQNLNFIKAAEVSVVEVKTESKNR